MLGPTKLARDGRLAAGLVLAAGLAGCAEPSSFHLRWRVDPNPYDDAPGDPNAPALTGPEGCTAHGLHQVRVQAFTEDGATLVDQRTFSCFPRGFADPDDVVEGPGLRPGTYQFRIQGVRRDGFVWASDGDLGPGLVVLDGVEILGPDEPVRLEGDGGDPVLPAPPQCTDGVDNDRDGLVDQTDLSCQGENLRFEDEGTRIIQFRMEVSLLDHNPNMIGIEACLAVGIDHFVARVPDGQELESVSCVEALAGPTFFTLTTNDPPTEVEVVARDAADQDVTVTQVAPVSPAGSTFLEIDFADTDFLTPITAAFGFVLDFGAGVSDCQDPAGGTLALADLLVTVLGAHGQVLPVPVELSDGTPLDGATPVACPGGPLLSAPVPWGGYLLDAKARSAAGEVCYRTEAPEPAAPGTPIGFRVPLTRVVPPPPSCVDCTTGDDCEPGLVCNPDGLCAPG